MLAVDDKRLFCERCQVYFSESCPAHGPAHFIKDSVVLEGAGDRAALSLPQCLVLVERSQDLAGGVAVFSQTPLSQGCIFGPYEGEGLLSRKTCTKYSWAIKDKGFFFFVDASDESKSNWMRYVACASSEEEQNLCVFQYHGRIYYRVSREIPAGAELRVWVGREYGSMLGLQLGDHVQFEFGAKEALLKTFQDVQVVSVGDSSPPLSIGEVYSEAASEGQTRRSPQSVTSSAPPAPPGSPLAPPGPHPDSSLTPPARPALKFNFVKGSESLVSLSRAQSRYWTFFGFEANRLGQFLDKTKIICKLCGGRLAYSGNTTNLRQHLIYKHRREFNQLMDSGVAGPILSPAFSFQRGGGPKPSPPPPPPAPLQPAGLAPPKLPPRAGEGSVSSSVTNKNSPAPSTVTAPPQVSAPQATSAIADFLVRDLWPPHMVEGEGFRQLIATLLPSYQLPSAHFLSQEVLDGAHRQGRERWAGLLRDAVCGAGPLEKALVVDGPGQAPGPRVSLSGEVWWHGWRGGARYVTLSAHFVDEDFGQRSLTLAAQRLGGVSVEARVREMAREWGLASPSFIVLGNEEEGGVSTLYPNLSAILERADSAASEQSAPPTAAPPAPGPGPPVACVLGVLRGCMRRILELPAASQALRRSQALVSKLLPFLSPAPSALAPPPALEELLADSALKAVLQAWGRDGLGWGSLYAAVQTLSDSQRAFARVLTHLAPPSPDPAPCLPEPCDWSLLQELCAVLKPLDVACSTLARERFPHLSLVKPLVTSLLSRHYAASPGDSAFRHEAKRAVRDSLGARYSAPELGRALGLACALDPRFRGLEFLEPQEREAVRGWLKEEALDLAQGQAGAGDGQGPKRTGTGVLTRGGKRARREARQPEPGAPIVLDDDDEEDDEEDEVLPESVPKEEGLSDMEFLLGGLCPAQPLTPQGSLVQRIERELAIFWAEPAVALGEEPLRWWRERAGQLPLLAQAARVYLAPPATTGPARQPPQSITEGGAMFHKRANIPPELLDQLLFLHHNRLSVSHNHNTTA